MLGFAQIGQVGIDDRRRGTLMAEVDLDLTQVLTPLQEMGRVTMAQRMDMSSLLEATGSPGQTEGPLQSTVLDRFGGGGCALSAMTFAGEKPQLVPMGFPLFSEQLQSALGQGDIAVTTAFAGADVQEHALGIDVGNLQIQTFAQAQAAGINGRQANAVIEAFDPLKDLAHFLGREHDRQFESWVSPDEPDGHRPGLAESFFPEQLDGADALSGSLAREFLFRFEVEEVLAEFFRSDELRRLAEILTEFTDTAPVAQDGAFGQRQQTQVVKEAV